jgi:hypothetical protein
MDEQKTRIDNSKRGQVRADMPAKKTPEPVQDPKSVAISHAFFVLRQKTP